MISTKNISNPITLHFRWLPFYPSTSFLVHDPFCPTHFLTSSKSFHHLWTLNHPNLSIKRVIRYHQKYTAIFHTAWTVITKNTFVTRPKWRNRIKWFFFSMIGLQGATHQNRVHQILQKDNIQTPNSHIYSHKFELFGTEFMPKYGEILSKLIPVFRIYA